jgi:hypothetical protein
MGNRTTVPSYGKQNYSSQLRETELKFQVTEKFQVTGNLVPPRHLGLEVNEIHPSPPFSHHLPSPSFRGRAQSSSLQRPSPITTVLLYCINVNHSFSTVSAVLLQYCFSSTCTVEKAAIHSIPTASSATTQHPITGTIIIYCICFPSR